MRERQPGAGSWPMMASAKRRDHEHASALAQGPTGKARLRAVASERDRPDQDGCGVSRRRDTPRLRHIRAATPTGAAAWLPNRSRCCSLTRRDQDVQPTPGQQRLRIAVQDSDVLARPSPAPSHHLRKHESSAAEVFTAYNHHHRHSGLGPLTPEVVHSGQAKTVHARRALVLDAAHALRRNRFHRPPQPSKRPDQRPDQQTSRKRGRNSETAKSTEPTEVRFRPALSRCIWSGRSLAVGHEFLCCGEALDHAEGGVRRMRGCVVGDETDGNVPPRGEMQLHPHVAARRQCSSPAR